MLVARHWITPYNLHPLSLGTLAYMLGVWGQAYSNFYIPIVLMLAGLIIIRITQSSYFLPTTVCCVIFFATGMLRFAYERAPYDKLFATNSKKLHTFTGTVCDITPHTHTYFKKRITISIDEFCYTAYLYLFVPAHDISQIDDQITLNNVALRPPTTSDAFIRTLRSKVIALHFDAQQAYIHKKSCHYSLRHYLFDLRTTTTSALCSTIQHATQPLYTSLFLGNKTTTRISTHILSRFTLWGISHHLARSGLHLVIVIWLWFACIQRLPLPTGSKHALLTTLGLIYYILSWPSLSFDRACLSFALYQACAWRRTPLDPMHAISCVTLIFLLISPVNLLCLDFQLSFGLTYALAWFNHAHTKLITTNNDKSIA